MKTPARQEVLSPFDYSGIEPEKAKRAREAVSFITARHQSVTSTIIEIGRRLVEVKADLGHGLFQDWLEAHFGWSSRTARNYMLAGQTLGDKTETVSDLPVSTVYELARAPEADRERVVAAVERAKSEGRTLRPEEISSKLRENPNPERFHQTGNVPLQAPDAGHRAVTPQTSLARELQKAFETNKADWNQANPELSYNAWSFIHEAVGGSTLVGTIGPVLSDMMGLGRDPWPGLTVPMLAKMLKGRVREASNLGIKTWAVQRPDIEPDFEAKLAAAANRQWLEEGSKG